MTEVTYSLPVSETVKTAWAKVSGAKGSIWAIIGLLFLAQLIVGTCMSLTASQANPLVFAVVFNVIMSLLQIIFLATLIYLGIRRAQDMPISYKMIKEVFSGRLILCIIGLYILELIVLIPAGLVAGIGVYLNMRAKMQEVAPANMNMMASLFYLAGALLFIFLSVRMWLAYGAVVDKKLNPIDALKLSFKATQGNVLNLIGLYIINLLIIVGGALALGIGLIWALPMVFVLYGEVYKRLATRQDIRPIS